MLRRLRLAVVIGILCTAVNHAQTPEIDRSDPLTTRVNERIKALQREADRLAGSAKTLVGDLRKLEIERDLRAAEAAQAENAVATARRELDQTTARLTALEQQRIGQLPGLKAQLVDLYKRGRTGYAQLLFGVDDLREFGRASRVVAAMVSQNQRRIDAHRRTLAALRVERTSLAERTRALEERQATARQARTVAGRAVSVHTARIVEIDSRRDLTAQYVGELQVARDSLLARLASPAAEPPGPPLVPLAPFRGALEWPIQGRLAGQFGQAANRLGGSAVRNGIEISAPAGVPVHAVHGGTVIHADAFAGFGTLVIIDHGSNHYSLYGYLGATSVAVGQAVETGAALGQVGAAPAGPTALYFEMRIDGRAVDPVQWLKPR